MTDDLFLRALTDIIDSSPTMARCSAAREQKNADKAHLTNFMAPGEPDAQVAYGA